VTQEKITKMAEVFKYCMDYLRSYGYPEYTVALCNRYFTDWVRTAVDNNLLITWKEQIERFPNEPLFKMACGMWLAGQLYNQRKALVDLALKAEEPDIMSPDTHANYKEKIMAWRTWNREQRLRFVEFLNLPDLDEKLMSNSATLYIPSEKRQCLAARPKKKFSVFSHGISLGLDNGIVMGFQCDGVLYLSTRHFLHKLGITGTFNDPVSRLMTEEEIAFIRSLAESEQISIFGTLTNWEKQTVFRESDLDTFVQAQNTDLQFKFATYRGE
jgi:hypothetical protein